MKTLWIEELEGPVGVWGLSWVGVGWGAVCSVLG